jgi:hypothetical protein
MLTVVFHIFHFILFPQFFSLSHFLSSSLLVSRFSLALTFRRNKAGSCRMLIRVVAAGWQQRTVMNIQLEKAFNEIKKKSKTGRGG